MLEKLKDIFIHQTLAAVIGLLFAVLVPSAAIYWAGDALWSFLLSSSPVNNALLFVISALGLFGLFCVYRKLRPARPDYFAYEQDEWGGMLWNWKWRLNERSEAEIDLQRPLCPECGFDLEPLVGDDNRLSYYCEKKTCNAVYETQFADEEEYMDYIRKSIMRRVRNGEYKEKLKSRA